MIEFLEALAGFLLSRLLYDYIGRRASAMGEIPLIWAIKTGALLFALLAIVGAFGMAVLYVLTRQS